jgi:hypothetical protein
MAGTLSGISGLTPQPSQVAVASNYITSFDFAKTELPDVYEKEFERYGNRSVASFLRLVSAEIPCASDLIKWTEQGRLHTKYIDCASDAAAATNVATITVSDTLSVASTLGVRVGQTVVISNNAATETNKGIVTAVATNTFDVAYYEAGGQIFAAEDTLTVFIYGSEFGKGTDGMKKSVEAESSIFENKPIIIKDMYNVAGSDMAQIGWVEVSTENGASGYLWYLKSKHETRLRFDDYLETNMLEAVPAGVGSGAVAIDGISGSDGAFYAVETRGNVWSGGHPSTLAEFDSIVSQLDTQGAIEENALFVNRDFTFAIDDMLAAQSTTTGASFGLFDNDTDMALNLGFSGFRRGYDFYKTDWKYLNETTMRGGMFDSINGMLVPAGTTTVYDQVLGKNAKRPFLHVRYRASQAEDRKLKTWITGSAGGASTNAIDAMEVNFLSERAICTLGANNFMLFTA